MKHFITLPTLAALFLSLAVPVFASNFGTAVEAKAMLEKTVAAIKANKSEALAQIAKGEAGFRDRDLYPFCGDSEGNFTAHPVLNGRSLKGLMDKSDKPLGEEIYAVAKEGEIREVSYLWPRPGNSEPVQKISFVTKVADQVCAVGYYR